MELIILLILAAARTLLILAAARKGPDLTENSAKFALYTGMASRLFINIFLQVQVDGPGLCGQAIPKSLQRKQQGNRVKRLLF